MEVNPNINRIWKCCCLVAYKEELIFFSVYAVLLSVVFFCFFQLATKADCHDQATYIGLLGTVLGVFIPSPTKIFQQHQQ